MAGDEPKEPLHVGAKTAAAFLLLFVAIVFMTISGVDELIWGQPTDLDRAAWVLLAVSVYVLFGLRLPDILDRRRDDE